MVYRGSLKYGIGPKKQNENADIAALIIMNVGKDFGNYSFYLINLR